MTRQKKTIPGRLGRLSALGLALLLTAQRPASGQETAMDYIKPLMEKDDYAALVGALDLDRDQENIVELLYADYLGGIESLSERVDEQAVAAGRKRLERVFSGRMRMGGDELRALRVKVLKTYEKCGPEADQLLADFISGLEGILQDPQRERFEAALRELRRRVLLHPRQTGEDTFNYAAEGVDVIQLVDEASQAGGELAGVDDEMLADVLRAYARRLDVVLRETNTVFRDVELERRIATLEDDSETASALDKRVLEAWSRLYELNRDTARRIGEIARQAEGEWAERLWIDRFDRKCFPWLFRPRKPDRQLEWIRANAGDPAVLQQAELKYTEFLAERDGLQREAVSILVEARLERGVVLHQLTSARDVAEAAGDLYNDMLRNSGAMSNLESKYVAEIEALLNEEQRNEMRRAIQRRR